MKRIAIFCDGTWNRHDAPDPTNVVKLSLATLPEEGGIAQQAIYLPGVGAGRGSTALARWSDRMAGGAMGWGMTENIEEAYRHLAFSYRPGDEIYVFGFSRGAFTARSLAGLIRASGIPTREAVGRIPEAIARYRDRDPATRPNSAASFRFRKDFAGWLTTSDAEVAWRARHGLGASRPLTIAYLGIWDTVGAMGVPAALPFAPRLNRRHDFHDHALSRIVRSARHAVAVDERRVHFPPTLWDNLDALSGDAEDPLAAPYRQHWFPGDHGSVGGGGAVTGLSDHALLWIAEGAAAAEGRDADNRPRGLAFDPAVLERITGTADHMAALVNQDPPRRGIGPWVAGLGQRDRTGPADGPGIAAITRKRWREDRQWRPRSLDRVRAHLEGQGG